MSITITSIDAKDIRWPTSLEMDGSDAMHSDPDYSCVYVTINTSKYGLYGNGLTFTLGRGTEIVLLAVNTIKRMAINRDIQNIFDNFKDFWRELTSESQLRWIGPEKGVTHLAVAAIVNALWDLWAKRENVPVWKLLVNMEPECVIEALFVFEGFKQTGPDSDLGKRLKYLSKRRNLIDIKRFSSHQPFISSCTMPASLGDAQRTYTQQLPKGNL